MRLRMCHVYYRQQASRYPRAARVRPQTKRGLEQYSGRLKAVGVVKAKTEP